MPGGDGSAHWISAPAPPARRHFGRLDRDEVSPPRAMSRTAGTNPAQVRARDGLIANLASSSKTTKTPKAAAVISPCGCTSFHKPITPSLRSQPQSPRPQPRTWRHDHGCHAPGRGGLRCPRMWESAAIRQPPVIWRLSTLLCSVVHDHAICCAKKESCFSSLRVAAGALTLSASSFHRTDTERLMRLWCQQQSRCRAAASATPRRATWSSSASCP